MFDVLVREHGAVKPDGRPCAELTMMMEFDADATVVVGRLVFKSFGGWGYLVLIETHVFDVAP